MSHATVLVKIQKPAVVNMTSVQEALDKVMAPYNEQPGDGSPYLTFEEQDLSEYETGAMTKVQMPNGDRVDTWDERVAHSVPEGCREIEVPFKEIYPNLAAFAEKYHGYDEHEGKYGFWSNANAKWDWFQIGGRWRGFFPLKPNAVLRVDKPGVFDNEAEPDKGDIVSFDEIDFEAVATQTNEDAEKFWDEWQAWLKNPTSDWDGPRSRALHMGLLHVVQGPAEGISWAVFCRPEDERRTWTDVPKIITEKEFFETYTCCFNPIVAFAVLDKDGWHEAGKLGWFGSSSDTPETYVEFRRTFMEKFIKDDGALYVVVDYHI